MGSQRIRHDWATELGNNKISWSNHSHPTSLQSYLSLCSTMDRSPPGSSVHGVSPGKNTGVSCHALLQWIFQTYVSCIVGGFFTVWATREVQEYWNGYPIPFLGELPGPGIELGSPALQANSLLAELPGKPHFMCILPQLKWKKNYVWCTWKMI